MSGLEIRLDGDRRAFRPGETARGRLRWDLPEPPRGLELHLVWRTEGKGTQDVGIAWTHRIEAPAARGEEVFAAPLPAKPCSFSGKLISLIWALEAVPEPGKEIAREDIVIAPRGVEVVLGSAKD